jgi:hypothetical protein
VVVGSLVEWQMWRLHGSVLPVWKNDSWCKLIFPAASCFFRKAISSEVNRGSDADGGGVVEGLVWGWDFLALLRSVVFSCSKSLWMASTLSSIFLSTSLNTFLDSSTCSSWASEC